MKSKVNYLGLIAVVLLFVLINKIFNHSLSEYWLILVFLPLVIFIYQLVFRYKKSSKNMSLSPLNIFSCKASKTITTDLDSDLLFEKVLLEIKNIGLKTQYIDTAKRSILVSKSMNLRTWGENIYFDVIENGEASDLLIQSASPQVISWGKNDENIERLVKNIEDSFTI